MFDVPKCLIYILICFFIRACRNFLHFKITTLQIDIVELQQETLIIFRLYFPIFPYAKQQETVFLELTFISLIGNHVSGSANQNNY